MESFSRIEYCVIDKTNNNVEVFDKEEDAIKYAKDNHYARVVEVGYGESNEVGDESEMYAYEVWSNDEDDIDEFEGTAYYDDKFKGVADVIETDEYSELETWAWNMLQQGMFIEVKNILSGKSQRLSPDDIEDDELVIDINKR